MVVHPTEPDRDLPKGGAGAKASFQEQFPIAYTRTPPLNRNPLLAVLQLFGWLFFHPSAWRGHIARIDPSLAPDFSLAQLTATQLRNPELRRLLFLGHVLSPIPIGVLLALELWALGVPTRFIAIRVIAYVVMSTGGSLLFAAASSTAVGIASVIMGGLAGGTAFALAVGLTGQVSFSLPADVSSLVKDFLAGGAAGRTTVMVAIGAAVGGMLVAVGGVGAGVSERRARLSRRPSFGGMLIGLLFGAFFFVAATTAARVLPFSVAISAGGFLAGLISAAWITRMWLRSAIFGLACALNNHLLVNVIAPMSHDVVIVGIMLGIILGAWFALPYMLAEEIAGSWAGAVAGSLGFSGGWLLMLSAASKQYISVGMHLLPGLISMETSVLLGLTEGIWRPLILFPFQEAWNLILLRLDQANFAKPGRPSFLRWHAAFWDENQRWPLYGLEHHLILVMERNPAEGRLAMEILSGGSQRWAAQAAQIEFDARQLERCAEVEAIAQIYRDLGASQLDGPASILLHRILGISQDVDAALSQNSAHNQRLGLTAVQQRLDSLISEIDRSSDRYAVRFRPVAARWRELLSGRVQNLVEGAEQRQEIDNPYVIGVPLTLEQKLFVGRTDISARIEQLLLDRRRPPLLMYGQRRMGKTSLLNNLGRLLPTTIVPLFVDLQGPAAAASDHAGLLYNMARGMIDSAAKQRSIALPPLPREMLSADPFTSFDEWLDRVEATLAPCTALLMLDEFDALDWAMRSGRFDENAVLGMLRHLVQHRQRIKTLFASSYTLAELTRWSNHMINVQVLQVGYLADAEALKLIEHPVKGFELQYEPAASQRVLSLTRGHPFLVQLLCAEIIELKNEQEPARRRLALVADVVQAVPAALQHGSFFFADIERNQVTADALVVLKTLAAADTGATRDTLRHCLPEAELGAALTQLLRRDLIEAFAGGYRFQVELIRTWFTQSAATG